MKKNGPIRPYGVTTNNFLDADNRLRRITENQTLVVPKEPLFAKTYRSILDTLPEITSTEFAVFCACILLSDTRNQVVIGRVQRQQMAVKFRLSTDYIKKIIQKLVAQKLLFRIESKLFEINCEYGGNGKWPEIFAKRVEQNTYGDESRIRKVVEVKERTIKMIEFR
ncbi:MAG: hypothetical protein J5965_26650 [Aeriscardovia sp.]|nr:hypothetical protein [Aeriscardovia sp.]